jgi:autotransporter-associated beta strand protein
MTLTESLSARVRNSIVSAIISTSATFRQFMCYQAITISQAIGGTTGVIKNGIGGLTFSGACNYTGPTQINAGQIAISSASTLNGVISGPGQLTKTGTTALTIGGSNTYSGGTLSAPSAGTGTIAFSQNNAFGTGLFTSAGPSQIIIANSATLANNFQINSGHSIQFRVNIQTTILTISGNIAGSGYINKTSTGQLHLNGNLTYTGTTIITAGRLRALRTIGASTATATFPVQGNPLAVSFNTSPPSGTTNFRFFQGTTVQTYASVTLTGVPVGTTATYNSATSTLSVTVP